MGADSRATAGHLVADKHCLKIHKLTDSIFACGAGTAADLNQVFTNKVSYLTIQLLGNKHAFFKFTLART